MLNRLYELTSQHTALNLYGDVIWWTGGAVIAVVGGGLIFFPIQVKFVAPTASFTEIFAVLYDCFTDPFRKNNSVPQELSAEELQELLKSSSPPLVVDTRPGWDYCKGHIRKAMHLPFNKFRNDFSRRLPSTKQAIVVTCEFGHYSPVAAKKLTRAGFETIYNYTKGMDEWKREDRPIVSGGPTYEDIHIVQENTRKSAFSFKTFYTISNRSLKTPVYLDYNATTPLDPAVLEVMMPYLTSEFGNAASIAHAYGSAAERAVSKARQQVADAIGATSIEDIVFTSGATESNNLAIQGVVEAIQQDREDQPIHIITCATEHKAVLDTCRYLEERHNTIEVTYLGVAANGLIDLQQLEKSIRPGRTKLVSIMVANNEIGVVQPVQKIGQLCRSHGIIFHTDATQGVGKVDINVESFGIDLMSISAHKLYGPKGVGALYVNRETVSLQEQIHGGGHEFGKRSGTLNVPGIVGLGKSCELAVQHRLEENQRMSALRDRLLSRILESLGSEQVQVNGTMQKGERLEGNLHLSLGSGNFSAEQVLMELGDDVAISSGSACNSRSTGPSHVIQALVGDNKARLACTLRLSVGRFSTPEEIDFAADRLVAAVRRCNQ